MFVKLFCNFSLFNIYENNVKYVIFKAILIIFFKMFVFCVKILDFFFGFCYIIRAIAIAKA